MQAGYILHTRAYRDTSLIADIFTEHGERFSAIARGARSNRRGGSQRALLQPFQPLWIECGGSGELKSLKQIEPRASAIPLQRQGLFSGFYVNELLCRLLHRDDPHPDLFPVYESALTQLLDLETLDVALRLFELHLLDELGYGVDLQVDVEGNPIESMRFYRYDAGIGLSATNDARAFGGRELCDFVAGNYTADARRTLKLLCRAVLRIQLGDKPLRSRSLFLAGK